MVALKNGNSGGIDMSIDVKSLIEQGEGQQIEFKRGFTTENEAIETICAFANSQGGTVLIGVSDVGVVVGAQLGRNTRENFANKLHRSTESPIYVSLTTHRVDDKEVVAVTVNPPRPGEVFYAFGRPLTRVGAINQQLSSEEQRARLRADQYLLSEEKDRPHFELTSRNVTRTEDIPDELAGSPGRRRLRARRRMEIPWCPASAVDGVAPSERSRTGDIRLRGRV